MDIGLVLFLIGIVWVGCGIRAYILVRRRTRMEEGKWTRGDRRFCPLLCLYY
jgi:hypothetical protein